MIFTLEKLQDSIASILKENYPNTKIYGNPNQQGTKTPCFFVFFMPTKMENEMDCRSRREIGVDLVYLTKRNIPDVYDQMTKVANVLDDVFDYIPYSDGTDERLIKVFDREWKIDDGELHYQFFLKVMVSHPSNTPIIQSIEHYEGGMKENA